MRAFNTARQSFSRRNRRMVTGIILLLFAVSTLSLGSVMRAEDPPAETATFGIMINYLGEVGLGNDKWLVEGLLSADDISAVTIQFSGCTAGTATPDATGYFFLIVSQPATDTLTVDAADGTNTAHESIVLSATGPATF